MVDTQQTVGEWLERLANINQSTDSDSQKMQNLLRRVGFLSARVVVGIVYLDGMGTIDAPPTDIHTIAKMLVTRAHG